MKAIAALALTLLMSNTASAAYQMVYVGTIGSRPDQTPNFANVIEGESYQVTLVVDNGGNSLANQTWAADDLVSIRFEFNDARDVTFEQDVDPSYEEYFVDGTATTDESGNLTQFFSAVRAGGPSYQTVGLDDFVNDALWYLNGQNNILYADANANGGSYRPTVGDATGGVSIAASEWAVTVYPGRATPTPVPTLPLYGLVLLFGLLGMLGLRKLEK